MQLKFAITPEMITGEAIRHHFTKLGHSARDLGKFLGLHESNISYMLSMGQCLRKHRTRVLEFCKISETELRETERKILSTLKSHGVELIPDRPTTPLIVLVPSPAVQKLVFG